MKLIWGGLALTILLLLPYASAGEIKMPVTFQQAQDPSTYFTPSTPLNGTIIISYSKLIPKTARLAAYIDNKIVSAVFLNDKVNEPNTYTYQNILFDYNLTADGTNNWTEYPSQGFSYTITASGTCGGAYCCSGAGCFCDCPCGDPQNNASYPCSWSGSFSNNGTVKGDDGLKFIYNASTSISEPVHNNNDTVWSVVDGNADVDTTQRKACGLQTYANQVWKDGWARRTLPNNEFHDIPGTSNKFINIEKFDNNSLDLYRNLYAGGPGGVYKNGVYQHWGNESIWNGSSGRVEIKNFISTATYTITYLTPNGPQLCAYTAVSMPVTQSWHKESTIPNTSANFLTPYTRQFSELELQNLLPPPPCAVTPCDQATTSRGAKMHRDPSGTANVSYASPTRTVTGQTSSTDLASTFTIPISLKDFPGEGMRAPSEIGVHTITLRVFDDTRLLAEDSTQFNTCTDFDGDGFCEEHGDCQPRDATIFPTALELCDNIDNNCDGRVDDRFRDGVPVPDPLNSSGSVIARLGDLCGLPTSSCAGEWTCSPNKLSLSCTSRFSPGELQEICSTQVDEDCDGAIDEEFTQEGGVFVSACICKDGDTTACGSNVGACREGFRVCTSGKWSECLNSIDATDERCDNIDNDCDGVADNVGGLEPADICGGLFAGTCNPGSTRACGVNVGACTRGIQTCTSAGLWGECLEAVLPTKEVCYNRQDDNCNGLVDDPDLCRPELTCFNKFKDANEDAIDCGGSCRACSLAELPQAWIIVSIIGVIIAVTVGVLEIRGKLH